MRADLDIIQQWIPENSQVLDLGCGNGELLSYLSDSKGVHGYGLEIDQSKIWHCLNKGVNVIEQNLDSGLENFSSDSFDVVVMTQTLQAVRRPDKLLEEMLRIGKTSIITLPNFGHWRCRLHLSLRGRMPVSDFMPYSWYDTPNIHFCTFQDFENLCRQMNIRILERLAVDHYHRNSRLSTLWPNLFGEIGIYWVSGANHKV